MFKSGKPKKKRGMKMLKGVNTQLNIKPKKVMTPYIAFVKKERPKLVRECPNLTFAECMKYLGERWKEMDDEQKKPFNEISARDQKRYDYEMANPAFTDDHTQDLMYKKPKKKKNPDGSTQEPT